MCDIYCVLWSTTKFLSDVITLSIRVFPFEAIGTIQNSNQQICNSKEFLIVHAIPVANLNHLSFNLTDQKIVVITNSHLI